MPPPASPGNPGWGVPEPFVMVKPFNTEVESSPLTKITTLPVSGCAGLLPSIMVVSDPYSLVTVIAMPLKLIFWM